LMEDGCGVCVFDGRCDGKEGKYCIGRKKFWS
jgi:hypothetical protein